MDPHYKLSGNEIDAIKSLMSEVTAEYRNPEDEQFLMQAAVYSQELPRSLRAFLTDFRMKEWKSGYCLLSGYPVDEVKVGPTPSHWKDKSESLRAAEEEMLLVVLGSLLGDVFSWSTQQAGHIVHNIMPIPSHENEQLGTGSNQLLWWHNEDAFHPYRGDYLGMMCLRNPDRVATTIACVDNVELDEGDKRLLFEPRYIIHPDESHLERNRGTEAPLDGDDATKASYEKIRSMSETPETIPVLFGSIDSPYLQIDPYFMPPVDYAPAQKALDRLVSGLDGAIQDLVMEPGDYCFIDNFRAVHGRKPFKARYDGMDRWLTRINITRDLRKSRSARSSTISRMIL